MLEDKGVSSLSLVIGHLLTGTGSFVTLNEDDIFKVLSIMHRYIFRKQVHLGKGLVRHYTFFIHVPTLA
jgi:hypothetical protein